MEKNNQQHFQEPEEKGAGSTDPGIQEAEVVKDNYKNPLDQPVTEKGYSRTNVTANPQQLSDDIPEPKFAKPPIDLTKPPPPPPPQEDGPKQPQEPFNPQMKDLKEKDKRDAAERAADTILDGYAWLKSSANQILKISDKTVKKLEMQKKIDLTIPIPYDSTGNMIPIAEFIREFNAQNEQTLKFETESREEIRPLLVQVLKEQGIGMTARDQLIYYSVKELISFGAGVWSGLAIKKSMLAVLQEHTADFKRAHGMQQPTQPQNTYTPPPPPPPPPSSPVTIITPHDPGDNGGESQQSQNDNGHAEYFEEMREDKTTIPPAMQGADFAFKITGSDQQHSEPLKKKRGAPTKEERENKKKLLAEQQKGKDK